MKIVEWDNGEFSVMKWNLLGKWYLDLSLFSSQWWIKKSNDEFRSCVGTKSKCQSAINYWKIGLKRKT